MDFTGLENCGNSPKNLRLAEWERAFALGEWDDVAALLGDDIVLEVATPRELDTAHGRDAVLALLREARDHLTGADLGAAITHGKEGATWGTWTSAGGVVHFAHAFRFANTTGTRLAWIRIVSA